MMTLLATTSTTLPETSPWIVIATPIALVVTAIWQQVAMRLTSRRLEKSLHANIAMTHNGLTKLDSLVNGAVTEALQITAISTRRLANVTRDPADIEIASLAQKRLEEHLAKKAVYEAEQKVLDDKARQDLLATMKK